jgi:ribosomal-protein-alanine N-acetyltransferase
MVARPPVRVTVELMKIDDLLEVQVIERESFTTPWPPHAYRQELENNRLAQYIVARCGDTIVGFAGIWLLVDEAHVTTFATRRSWRRQGIGDRLLLALLDLARTRGAHEATLEVRPSNIPARRLYEKYGFKVVGVRPRYYSDDNEDALIMTTESLDGRHMRDRITQLRAELAARPDIETGPDGLPVRRLRGEEHSPETDGSTDSTASGAADGSPSVEPREPRVIRPSSVMRRTK